MTAIDAAALLSATGLLLGTTALLVSIPDGDATKLPGGRVLAGWLLSYAQVVLISEVLSEVGLLGRAGYLAGHATLFAVALLWWWTGRGSRRPDARARMPRPSTAVVAFGVAIGLLCLVNLWLAADLPPMNGDANAYHLPRAYYWLRLGTARHFPAVDFRMTEFPPDPSFVFTWVMALSGGFDGLHVPQWTAGLALASGVVGLARLAGADRSTSAFAGALTLTLPAVVLQMGSAQTDLFAAATATGALLFGLRYVTRPSPGDQVLFGVAVGLAFGTKLTVLFLAPGVLLAMLLLRPGRRLLPLLGAGVAGFALFGAYNMVLNLADFGHPIASPFARAFSTGSPRPGTNGRLANALRYGYQTLDWPGFPPAVAKAQETAFQALGRALGQDLEADVWFDPVIESRTRPDEDRSGFGPIGFLALVCAPLLLVRGTRVERALLVAGLSFPVAFLVYNPGWTAQKVRYLLVALPPILAVALPRLARSRPVALASAALALVVAGNVVRLGPPPPNAVTRVAAAALEEVMSARAREIPALVAPGGRIGVVSSFNDTLFHLYRTLPAHRFVPAAEDEVPSLLANGSIDAALVGEHRDEEAQGSIDDSFLLPRNLLLTRDAVRGLDVHETGDGTWVLFRRRTDLRPLGGSMRLRVARVALDRVGEDAALVVPFEGAPSAVVEIPRSGGGGSVYRDVRIRVPEGAVVRGASMLVPRRWIATGGVSDVRRRLGGERVDLLQEESPFAAVEGLHGIERNEQGPFRWTNGRLVVRLDGVGAATLRVATLGYRGDASVTLLADGRVLHTGIAAGGVLEGTFPLPEGTRTVKLSSDVVKVGHDGRDLGLCLRELGLELGKETP